MVDMLSHVLVPIKMEKILASTLPDILEFSSPKPVFPARRHFILANSYFVRKVK